MLQMLNKINSIHDLAMEVLQIEADSILKLKDRIGEDFEKAIDILYDCKGRVIVTGMGKSGHIGRKIAATLSSTGTPSYFLHPAESTHGDSGLITRDDVVIAISNSGETAELMNLLPLIERFGVKFRRGVYDKFAFRSGVENMAGFAFRQIRNLPCPVNCNDGAVSLFSPDLRIILFGGERQKFSVLQNLAVLRHKAEIKLQHFAMVRREVFELY